MRYLLAAVCTPLALSACDGTPGDTPQKPKVVAASGTSSASSEPITTGPAGKAYPVPSISIEKTPPVGSAAPAAATPAAATPAAAAPSASAGPAADRPAGASPAAKDTPVNAPGTGELTKEEEKNQMPMPGQVHNYSGDARKAGQVEATPTGKKDNAAGPPTTDQQDKGAPATSAAAAADPPAGGVPTGNADSAPQSGAASEADKQAPATTAGAGGAPTASAVATAGKPAAAGTGSTSGSTSGLTGAGEAAKDKPANAPGTGELTAEEEKNQMPMPGQVHNYSGDARKAGQNEATPTGKNDDAASSDTKPAAESTAPNQTPR